MAFDKFRDLKKGDRVHFENIDYLGERISGEGSVYSFAESGCSHFVWVDMGNRNLVLVPYEEIRKVAPTGNVSRGTSQS